MSDDISYGESTTRQDLPDEVLLRVMRRADAEQNRHLNLARIADALGEHAMRQEKALNGIEHLLTRIADALDRAYPLPEYEYPDEISGDESGAELNP